MSDVQKKSWRGALSVLLYESQASALEDYLPQFERIFNAAGYPVRMRAIVPASSGATKDQADILEKEYFDVVISDVSMGGPSGNVDGLYALHSIKQSNPDLFCIAYSGKSISFNRYSNLLQFDLFLDKEKLFTPMYMEVVSKLLRERIRVNIHAYVLDECRRTLPDFTEEEFNHLNRIVRKITYTGLSTDESLRISMVNLLKITAGFSGAQALYMQATTTGGLDCLQAVLKLGRRCDEPIVAAIRHEAENYRQLVRWHLPYDWRPELLAESHGGPLSAICYAFVSSRDEPFISLSEMIRRRDPDAVSKAIESIFHPRFQRWYHPNNVRQEHSSLNEFYINKCFDVDSTEQTRMFLDTMAAAYEVSQDGIRLDATTRCPLPNLALPGRTTRNYLSCLIHGDLNANNVFVAPSRRSREAKFIDFAQTGRGHVFFDFIVFEVSVRLEHLNEGIVDLRRQVELEQALNHGQRVDLPYARSVLSLRKYARRNFPAEKWDNYLFGVAAFSLSLMSMKDMAAMQVRALAACVSASLLFLQSRGFWGKR